MKKMTRRNFVKASTTISSFFILPSGLLSNPPSSKLGVAFIGIGGNGRGSIRKISSHPKVQVVALCDADKKQYAGPAKKNKPSIHSQYPDAQTFQDYREMFDKMGDKIDAVNISTCDHNHHSIAMAAMKLGKHVYCQKPLTHKISEARELMEVAKETGIANQMGIQLHASISNRITVHYIQAGVIGKIKKVYTWSNKKWGIDKPTNMEQIIPVPETLNWDVWLGNAAKRPYRNGYHPNKWRKFLDFGCGTLGDMGVHIFDTPFWALELSPPISVINSCRKPNGYSHPVKNIVQYNFKGTKYTTEKLDWTWYDGRRIPQHNIPELQLPEDMKIPEQGAVYVGETGVILHPHMTGPTFFPRSIVETLQKVKLEPVNHFYQWVDACFDSSMSTSANFDYAAPLTETVLLGVIGNRFPNKELEWDSLNMKFTNMPEANKFV